MKRIVVATLFCLLVARSAHADLVTLKNSDSRFHDFDVTDNNQGWWSNFDSNHDANDNYVTGFTTFGILVKGGPTEFRSFFTLNLSTLDLAGQVLLWATLEIVQAEYNSSDPSETVAFFDVSTPAAALNNNDGINLAIFNDLVPGTIYRSFGVPQNPHPPRAPERLAFPLNTAALADIASATSGVFLSVARFRSFSNEVRPGAETIFAFSSFERQTAQLLTLEVAPSAVPEPGSFLLFGAGAILLLVRSWSSSSREACASPIWRTGKIVDAGAIAGASICDASRRSDGRGNSIRLIDTSRPAARDPGPAPSAGRARPFEIDGFAHLTVCCG